jgi:hypothetical protein
MFEKKQRMTCGLMIDFFLTPQVNHAQTEKTETYDEKNIFYNSRKWVNPNNP